MLEPEHIEFNTKLLSDAVKGIDLTDKKTWTAFAARVSDSAFYAVIKENVRIYADVFGIIESAYRWNNIYIAKKEDILFAMYFCLMGSVIIRYNTTSKKGSIDAFEDLSIPSKLGIFIMGEFKEHSIIDSFLHINRKDYDMEFEAFTKMRNSRS